MDGTVNHFCAGHKMYVEGWGGVGWGGDRGTWEYLLALKDGARAAVTCS